MESDILPLVAKFQMAVESLVKISLAANLNPNGNNAIDVTRAIAKVEATRATLMATMKSIGRRQET